MFPVSTGIVPRVPLRCTLGYDAAQLRGLTLGYDPAASRLDGSLGDNLGGGGGGSLGRSNRSLTVAAQGLSACSPCSTYRPSTPRLLAVLNVLSEYASLIQ